MLNICLLMLSGVGYAQLAPPVMKDVAPKSVISPEKLATLQSSFEKLLQSALPNPLHNGSNNWGKTTKVVNGVKWHGLKPELQHGDRNDGTWRKYTITLQQPVEKHFRVKLHDAESIGNDRILFHVDLGMDIWFKVIQQNWAKGIKLFDGDARGTVTLNLKLTCVSTLHLEKEVGSSFPKVVYRLQVTNAKTEYSQLKIDYVAGIGGELAEKIGDWTQDAVKQLKPSWEEKLLEKANQAIMKAADTKELQLGLSGIGRKGK